MRKSVTRPFAVVLAFVTMVAASLVLGLSAASAAPATLSFSNSPTGPETAGLVFSTANPGVLVSGNSASASVTFSITPGTGTPGAVLTCGGTGPNGDTFAVGGVGPINVNATGCSINRDGNGYTLTATDSLDGGSAVSSAQLGHTTGFNVTGGASRLVITQGPTNTVAGQDFSPGSVTVQIENTDNTNLNPASTFANDQIALKIASGPVGGQISCLPQPASGGLATFFACFITKTGSYTLTAVDQTNPFITPAVQSAPFLITPAVTTQVVYLAQPLSNSTVAQAPGTFPITVAEEDQFNNIETNDSSTTVTMSFATNPGSPSDTLFCPGTANGTVVFQGVATFSPGCSIDVAADGYQLSATNSTFTVVSNFFNVGATSTPATVPTTEPATFVTANGATLNGSLNPGGSPRTCSYLYSTDPGLAGALSTPNVTTTAATTPVSVPIAVAGLNPSTTYYFELNCSDGLGGILSFTTLPGSPPPPPPGFVQTNAATPVTSTSATLNGTVNPGGVVVSCSYLYGTSPALVGALSTGTLLTSAAVTPISVPVGVAGLIAGTTYYFELVCSNGTGGILSFTTPLAGTVPLIDIAGPDAIGTSVATSQNEFSPGSAPVVVLARSDFFSDALTGGPLAAFLGGPLLITPGTPLSLGLDPRVLAEIQRVLTPGGAVYILGGTQALSPWIDLQLANLGYVTVRVAGANEYGTAVDVAGLLGNPSTIFEATGLSFQDALSAGPAAIRTHGAILLTNGAVQSPETAAYLAAFPGDTRYAVGGALAAFGADPTATEIAGADLYGTSAAVAQTFFGSGVHVFAIATGTSYQDALGGGVFISTGGRSGPMLLVAPNVPLPPSIAAYLATLGTSTQGYAFGGFLAISTAVLIAVQAAIG